MYIYIYIYCNIEYKTGIGHPNGGRSRCAVVAAQTTGARTTSVTGKAWHSKSAWSCSPYLIHIYTYTANNDRDTLLTASYLVSII